MHLSWARSYPEVLHPFFGLEEGEELPRLPDDVTPRADLLVPHGHLPGDLREYRPADSREGHVDCVWVLVEDERDYAMETEFVPKDNAVILGNKASQYLVNGAVGVLQRVRGGGCWVHSCRNVVPDVGQSPCWSRST